MIFKTKIAVQKICPARRTENLDPDQQFMQFTVHINIIANLQP